MIKIIIGGTLALIIMAILIVVVAWAIVHVLSWWEYSPTPKKLVSKLSQYLDKLEQKYKGKR